MSAPVMDEREAWLRWLRWQADMGADEALLPAPVNRLEPPPPATGFTAPPATQRRHGTPAQRAAASASPAMTSPPAAGLHPPAEHAGPAPRNCHTLEDIHAALDAMHHFPLRRTARHTVFTDGNPKAPVMFIGEAPGRDEDLQGKPFVGRAGQLLDRMLAAIGLNRHADDPARAALITNVLFWRPPGNRKPTDAELSFCAPWVMRAIELIRPRVIVTLGGTPTQRLTGQPAGIMRLRGKWMQCTVPGLEEPVPLLPTLHPAYLLRQPAQKRLAWRDLLALREFLDELARQN